MLLQEYINTIEDNIKRNLVCSALGASLECIGITQARLGRLDEELNFSIYNDGSIQAGASEYAKLISFTTGLVDHYIETKFPDLHAVIPGAPLVLGREFVVDLGLTWSLNHEHVHIYRCHDSVDTAISEAAQEKRSLIAPGKRAALNLSKEEISKAFEHDADLCSIATVYRYLQRRMGRFIDDMTIRKMALFYVYWGIRALPENEHSDSHPMLYERLYEIITKLGQLTVNAYQPNYVVGQYLEVEIRRSVELMKLAVQLEQIYISETKQKYEADAMWRKWWLYIRREEHTKRAEAWSKVSPWVEELSGTRADNRKDVFFYKRKEQERQKAEIKRGRKLQRKARAKNRS